jgi:gliding-associated putative ABC transporter substrate-binding component GldG
MVKRKTIKQQHIVQYILVLALLIVGFLVASQVYWRIDLTSDQRYTLSKETKNYIKQIDDIAYIKVFLENENLPAELLKVNRETRILLHEFKSINNNIEYEFYDPIAGKDKKAKNAIIKDLNKKGIYPSTMLISEADAVKEQIFFPWAVINYKGKDIAIPLLKNSPTASPQENLQNSINGLEYEWMNAFKKASTNYKPVVGLLKGHGELDNIYLQDFMNSLTDKYTFKELNIRNFKVDSLTGMPSLEKMYNRMQLYDALIVAKPMGHFTDLDKYYLDQFIMRDGKVLWLIDAVQAEMDSLASTGSMVVFPKRDLNLDDILFKYGARVNNDIIKDISCAKIPLNTSTVNNQPQWKNYSWIYFPIVFPNKNHSITNNLGSIKMEFASTIDTIRAKGIKKSILLQSSPYTGVKHTPSQIHLFNATKKQNENDFKAGPQNLAVLLEGKFESFFKNKIRPNKNLNLPYQEKADKNNKMIVVSDGDIIRNPIIRGGKAGVLGYDKYERRQYSNKSFLTNCLDYLIEDESIINLRNREIKLRFLDPIKSKKERSYWQTINVVLPLILLVLFTVISLFIRKRKYTK